MRYHAAEEQRWPPPPRHLSLMIPYSITFTIVWTMWLLIWVGAGLSLGIGSELWYQPPTP